MDDAEFAKGWEKIRSRGALRYVVTRGASWGGCVTGMILIAEMDSGFGISQLHLLTMLAACIAVGCFVAPFVWHKREVRYKNFIERSSGASQ